MKEAKVQDAAMKKAMAKPNPKPASLAQKVSKHKVIKLNKQKPVKLTQSEDISKEDQEEAD